MKKVIILNGAGESGKNTFVQFCRDILSPHNIYVDNISSVDQIKEAAALLGWDGVKDDRSRKFLSDLKDLSTAFNDGPLRYMVDQVESISLMQETLVFLDIREPEEIQKAKGTFHAITVLIRRTDPEQFSNHADRNVENYSYDYVIDNYPGTTFEELKQKVKEFLQRIEVI